MRKRDFLKKKVKQTGDPLIWKQYKHIHEIARIMKLKVQKVNILRLTLRLTTKIQNQHGNLIVTK